MLEFERGGARFSYPESWSVTDDSTADNIQVTAQSPGSGFWTLILVPGAASLESMIESFESAYQEDYPDGDVGPRSEIPDPRGTALRTRAEFLCLDLVVEAQAVAFHAGNETALVLTQAAEVEMDEIEPVFEAITASLRFEDDPLWPPSALGE